MKNQLITMTIIKEDLEKLVNNYELQFIALKNNISVSSVEHVKNNSIRTTLEMKIEALQVYIYVCMYLGVCMHLCIYDCVCVCICIYIYIYE
jgi:hypothetical protein